MSHRGRGNRLNPSFGGCAIKNDKASKARHGHLPPRPSWPFTTPSVVQVVYLLDAVRALEMEMRQRLEDSGKHRIWNEDHISHNALASSCNCTP